MNLDLKISFLVAFLLLTSLSLTNCQIQDQDNTNLPYEQDLRLTHSQSKFIKVDISDIKEHSFVSFQVLSDKQTAPSLFISKTKEYPSDPQNAEYYSEDPNGNVINIPSQDLAGLQSIFVGLFCRSSSCDVQLSFGYIKELNFEADGSRHIESRHTLDDTTSVVVRLHVPQVENANRVVIHIDAISKNLAEASKLKVYVTKGTDIVFSNKEDTITRSSWFEGQSLVIHKDNPAFCTDCILSLSIQFAREDLIAFEAHTYAEEVELKGSPVLDAVHPKQVNYYFYNVSKDHIQEEFVISVRPQRGHLKIYIECDPRPELYTNYHWRYDIEGSEDIILTYKEHTRCKTERYNIAVYSDDGSLYSLRAAPRKINKLYLGANTPIMGDIFNNEVIEYEIYIPLVAAERIRIVLEAKAALGLDVTSCRFPNDCPGLLPGTMEARYSENALLSRDRSTEFKPEKTVEGLKTSIIIDTHSGGCYPILVRDEKFLNESLPVCAYKIIVSSDHGSPIEYKLTADPQGHDLLYIGEPKTAHSNSKESHFYMVYVPHKNPNMVSIQLTKFSGDVKVFASRENKFPVEDSHDNYTTSHEGFIIYKNLSDLSGMYYIGVISQQVSSYSISISVLAEDGSKMDYALLLDEGIPQRGVILPQHEHPERYYKIDLNLIDNWNGTLRIVINALKGHVLLAVNNNEAVPSPAFSTWKTKGHELEVPSTDNNFKRKGFYHVGVYVDWDAELADEVDDVIFSILYYLKDSDEAPGEKKGISTANLVHILLTPMNPFHGTVKKGEADFFEVFVLPRYQQITIHKQSDVGDVDLFASIDPNWNSPRDDTYTHTTKNSHTNSILITKEELDQLRSRSELGFERLYVSVIPRAGEEEVSFTLSITPEYETGFDTPTMLPLEDGRQLQLSVPKKNNPAYFYFYPLASQYSVVTVTCPDKDIIIYANSIKVVVGIAVQPTLTPPTEAIHNYSSKGYQSYSVGFAHINIPPPFTSTSSIVTLAVFFNDTDNTTKAEDESKTFTILASSHSTNIFTGSPYYGVALEDQYTYYSFAVFQQSCTILISLTMLNDGDADLVVSYGADERPTIEKHEFASISSQKTELIEIDKLDIYPRQYMGGTWMVGVYGRSNSTFTLTVLFEEQKIVNLRAGIPFEMFLKESSKIHFKFYHENNKNVQINLNKFSGQIDAYVTNLPKDVDFALHLPNKTHTVWSISHDDNVPLVVYNDNPQACSECLYLITLEAVLSGKFAITVTEGAKIIKIQTGLHYTNQIGPFESSLYVFTSQNEEEATLNFGMRGPQLRVYVSHNPTVNSSNFIWNTTLMPNTPDSILKLNKADSDKKEGQNLVWDGYRLVKSQRDSFYVYFENPTMIPINYSFTATTKEGNVILKSGFKHATTIGPQENTEFLFYSPDIDEIIKVIIEIIIKREAASGSFDENLLKGLIVGGEFWSDKMTAGVGAPVILKQDHLIHDKVETEGTMTIYHLRQILTTNSKKGRFSFSVYNDYNQEVDVTARIYSARSGVVPIDQNNQYSSTLTRGRSETLEVYLAERGLWYVWVYACSGDLELSIADSSTGQQMEDNKIKLSAKEQSFYHIGNKDAALKYIRLNRGPDSTKDAHFMLITSHFNEDRWYEFDPVDHNHAINHEYDYDPVNSRLRIQFHSLEFHKWHVDPMDEIVYHVKVCPYKEEVDNLCSVGDGCRFDHHKVLSKLDSGQLTSRFDKLPPGSYAVYITANLDHLGKLVKTIPYHVTVFEIKQPFFSQLAEMALIILFGAAALCIISILCFKGYKKLKQVKNDGNFELQMFGQRRTYDVLGQEN